MKRSSTFSNRYRLAVLSLFVAIIVFASCYWLMTIQIVNGAQYLEDANTKITSTTKIPAARGDIVDRYGRVLATSETAFDVVMDFAFIPRSELNQTIAELVMLFDQHHEDWLNELPIARKRDGYQFIKGQQTEVERLKEILELPDDASAKQCVLGLQDRYEINTKTYLPSYPIVYQDGKYQYESNGNSQKQRLLEELELDANTSAQDCVTALIDSPEHQILSASSALQVVSVRYSMLRKEFSIANPYTFASDISKEMVIIVKEQSYRLRGVDISEVPTRVYENDTVASHLIGTVGPIYAEEYEDYKEKGYPMNAIVGKSGIESALESTLRGIDGEIRLTQNSHGDIITAETLQETVTGDTVVLSIDSLFQEKLQELLAQFVAQSSSGGYRSKGGAIVVLDVRTGEVLAAVNSANYTIAEYKENYSGLLEEETNPLFNRAVDGAYRPGSTLKPLVAAAGLSEQKISRDSLIYCSTPNQYGFRCLQDHHSGNINVVQSLHWSCNSFYYQLGGSLGIKTLNEYAAYMGLGESTGLEIKASKGRFASPETTENLGGTWNPVGDTMQAAIGQNETAVSPLQMACMAMTIANQGTRYETHLVHATIDIDGKENAKQPVVASEFTLSDSAYQAISDGMQLAASKVQGSDSLSNLGYGVAQKTGTPQTTASNRVNNAFIGYLPIDQPEIAISCLVEDCDTGTARLMRKIIELYYECQETGKELQSSQNSQ